MRGLIAVLLFGVSLAGQDLGLARVKQELKTARDQESADQKRADEILRKTGAWPDDMQGRSAARMARVHAALLNWIEARLPMGPSTAAIKSSDWETAMHRELAAAGIAEKEVLDDPDRLEDPGFGGVSVALTWKPELPEIEPAGCQSI
jgi:hypothetical protein